MRISSETRLATIRHCATKLPLLLLLYLLCPTDPFKPSPRPVNAAPPTSSPFRSTLYALSLLLILVRPLVLTLDESLARAILANPFPPRRLPHQDRRRHSRPRSLRDWSKRVSQLGWRAHSIWQRGRFPLLALLLTGFLLLAVPIGDLLQQVQHESEQGWSVVAGRWLSSRRLEAGSANTARGWKPLRNVVWLEILDALACVSHGLLPLLIHLRLLPPSLNGNFLLTDHHHHHRHPHKPSSLLLRFPTPHLLSSFHLAILSPSLTLLQTLQLVLARSPSTHKWFGGFWTTLVFLVAVILPLDAIAVRRERSTREAERLLEIGQTFAAAAAKGDQGGRGGEEGDKDELEDHWICSICLRGSGDSPDGDAPPGKKDDDDDDDARGARDANLEKQIITFDTRCHLPCAHSFHAYCLSTWFSTVSSCPTCHRTIKRPTAPSSTSTSSSSSTTGNSTPPPAAVTSRDRPVSEPYFTRDAIERAREEQSSQVEQYPGAAAAAARERRRAALLLQP